MTEINILDAVLHIDVYCYHCKKLCAMSNVTEIDGRYYCNNCKMLYEPHKNLDEQFVTPERREHKGGRKDESNNNNQTKRLQRQ